MIPKTESEKSYIPNQENQRNISTETLIELP